MQQEMKPLLANVLKSVGKMIELSHSFTTMQNEDLFQHILTLNEKVIGLDMRTQCNYSMLLYSTGKVIFESESSVYLNKLKKLKLKYQIKKYLYMQLLKPISSCTYLSADS